MAPHPSWDEQLFALFDDLEGQASALYELERDAELVDRSRAEYHHVTLDSRLVASLGSHLALTVAGVGRIEGELQRLGAGWCLLSGHAQDWIVRTPRIEVVQGASQRSVPEVAWSPLHKLSVSSALRRLAESQVRCVVHVGDAGQHEAVVRRVGADFVEISTPGDERVLISYDAISAVQSRD
ncbi:MULTISPECIES: hypothetical protein [Nocardioides]|uniref:hypothetical protein n=1 Tax=Nocardioides TaxID=1839 RepID=UPI00032DEA89|nr:MULTISPECIES: hypothetical protein [Nocardioides]EON24714.1 hypothetical protein CF8_1201 [Nocardioides sp. CF8]